MTVDVTPLIVAAIYSLVPIVLGMIANFAWKAVQPTIVRYLGQKDAALLQERVNQVLERAIGFAVQQASATVQSHGAITMDTKSWMVGEAVRYATKHAPDLMTEAGDVLDKVLARFDTHPAVQGLVATMPASAPASLPAAA